MSDKEGQLSPVFAARAFEFAPLGLVVSTLEDGRFVAVNQRFCEISGWTAGEIIGRTGFELDMWPDPNIRERLFAPLRETGRVDRLENQFREKSGALRVGRLSAELIELEGALYVVTAILDVTEHRKTEHALELTSNLLAAVAEAVPDLILILDEDGRYVEVLADPAHEKLLYKSAATLRGRLLHEIMPALDADRFLAIVRKTIDTGEPQVVEYSLDVEAGLRWFEGRTAPHRGGTERPVAVWVARDITERRDASATLERMAEQRRVFARTLIETQERERSRIARELHDDLGQLLTALKLSCRSMVDKMDPDSPMRDQAIELGEHLGDAMDAVRDLARGLRPGALDDLGLGPAIESLAERAFANSNIACELDVQEGITGVSAETSLAVYRIAQEALTNVIRHSQASRVSVTLRCEGEHVKLTVDDDGSGVTAQPNGDDAGFGILGMRERASLLGGSLSVVGGPEIGTVVELRIPLKG